MKGLLVCAFSVVEWVMKPIGASTRLRGPWRVGHMENGFVQESEQN